MTRRVCLSGLVLLSAWSMGCGKKGPPLAPIARIPAAVEKIDARRIGNDVYVTLTVPAQNIDATTPAFVRRVDVYAKTAVAPPSRLRFMDGAALVGTVPVAPPPPAQAAAAEAAPDPTVVGAAQGAVVTIHETLPAAAQVPPGRARRYYMAVASSDRGRQGPAGPIVELPLVPLPAPPAGVEVAYTADTITVSWSPGGGLFGYLLDRALPLESPPFGVRPPDDGVRPPDENDVGATGPTRYDVYREVTPDPLALPNAAVAATPWTRVPPAPVNPAPLDVLTFSEDLQIDDRERCYRVRAVRGQAPGLVASDLSAPACARPVDVFPPETPTNVSAVAREGAISLVWDPNVDLDLAGYLVLRGEPTDATLAPITARPIRDPEFVDSHVKPGVRYAYAVVAVDSRVPVANVSNESARVEETAR